MPVSKVNSQRNEEHDFWERWKNKTKQELGYIRALKKARQFILRKLPHKKVCSIYVKGSFGRRELTPKSDIDVVIVTPDSKMLNEITDLAERYHKELKPAEIVTPYSLWELKHSKSYPYRKKSAKPAVFLFHLEHHKLIYGKPLRKENYKIRNPKQRLKDMIYFMEKDFIPAYYTGSPSSGFRNLAKQIFWLADLELMIKEKHSPHTFKEMAKRINDTHHIVHDAIKIRNMSNTKDQKLRKDFIKKLKKYLTELKKLV